MTQYGGMTFRNMLLLDLMGPDDTYVRQWVELSEAALR